jgi:hypothetical protein
MHLLRLNGKQERLMYFIYELRNTPERGVGPDPRLTLHGLAKGTCLSFNEAKIEIDNLMDRALINSPLIGRDRYYYLTPKGLGEMEKVQSQTVRFGVSEKGIVLGVEKTETKNSKKLAEGNS